MTLGLREDEIAIKSAERNDLKAPERQNLTNPNNPVRFIITKAALQEGWDCPFAYVLCSLAAVSSRGALTQLIGRILRQPDTEKTGIVSLDECYVFCVHSRTKDVIGAIKNGLEQDGMGDLAAQLKDRNSGDAGEATTVRRRKGMETLRIFLPLVRWVESGRVRDLDYEMDLLGRVDPLAIGMEPLAKKLATGDEDATSYFMRIGLVADHKLVEVQDRDGTPETPGFDPVHVCRSISDLVPNGWQARALVKRLLEALTAVGVDVSTIGERTGLIIDQLRLYLEEQLDLMAEAIFRKDIASGRVQFSLHTDGHNYKVPDAFEAMLAKPLHALTRDDGVAAEKSLFVPATEDGMNGLERNVACYVDGKAATHWWFRNVARSQYGLQGWRKHKVYPDLVVAVRPESGSERILALETKGQHLDNPDSRYKRDLLDLLTGHYQGRVVGTMQLDFGDDRAVHCELVLENDWKTRMGALVNQP
jgi:type III restriction enzyme